MRGQTRKLERNSMENSPKGESHNSSGKGSFANIFYHVLKREFSATDDASEGTNKSRFNNSVAEKQVQ